MLCPVCVSALKADVRSATDSVLQLPFLAGFCPLDGLKTAT